LLSGRRLDPARFETILVHGSLAAGERSMADLAEREGARMMTVPKLVQPPRPHLDAVAFARVASIARRFRPDIVHTHTAKAGFVGRLAALAAVRPRPAIVHTYHGHVLEGYFGPTTERAYRSIEALLARRSDCLIGVSQATVDDLVRLGVAPSTKFRVVPLGLDLEPFARVEVAERSRLRAELGIGEDEVVATFVGRVVPIKRVDLLLRAAALARRRVPLRLLVVGDGELRPRLEAQARELGIADVVSFLGYRRDLPAIATASDVAVLTSANEGTPVSLIEAAAVGRPAVATDVGGVAEVVTPETGLLVPSNDAEAFAAALVGLASDPELRARLGAGARERALRRYSASRLVADIEGLYEELVARRRDGKIRR
jgi:glycosyltransferase involved in cell wall biosynthesis